MIFSPCKNLTMKLYPAHPHVYSSVCLPKELKNNIMKQTHSRLLKVYPFVNVIASYIFMYHYQTERMLVLQTLKCLLGL